MTATARTAPAPRQRWADVAAPARSNDAVRRAVVPGRHPFGAVLVGHDHETALVAQCSADTVNHAGATLARVAASNYSRELLWGCALCTAIEPRCMCTGAANWANDDETVAKRRAFWPSR